MPLPANLQIQPQEAPLNGNARTALQDLTRKYQNDRALTEKLRQSAAHITDVTAKINDAAYLQKQKHARKVARLAKDGEEEDENDKQEHEDFQNKVVELTKRMDHSMRKTIDNRIWAEELPNTVRQVSTTAINSSNRAAQRSTQANQDEDGENEDDTVSHEDTPSAILQATLTTNATRWSSKKPTDRYAHDNDYASFYKTLWDAQHPSDEAPPLPAPGLWFAKEENPSTTLSQDPSSQHGLNDADLQIASERVSLKCPITLQYFKDPVTSDVCKHSFERTAIFNMLKSSTDYVPLTPAQSTEISQLPRHDRARRENQMRIKRVRCPESACSQSFSETSLRPNPVLLRKVARELDAQRRRDEAASSDVEDEDELHGPPGTQRKPFPLGLDGNSSPPSVARVAKGVKAETERFKRERLSGVSRSARGSVVPQTQVRESVPPSGTQRTTREGATVVELDDDEEDESMI